MNRISKNQKGFTAVEVLLVILILVVIGAVGYMVYHNDHHKNVTANVKATSATKPVVTNSKPASSTQYLKITQLGIELPLSSTISDLSYTWDNDSASFGSAALIKYAETQDPSECSFTNPDGSVASTTYGLGHISSGSAASDFSGNYKAYTIGGKTYTLYLPENGCSTSVSSSANKVTNEVDLYENALEDALQNAKTY
jgi:prepilin-type N-terminal cleavage/methylation domain-containing protein